MLNGQTTTCRVLSSRHQRVGGVENTSGKRDHGEFACAAPLLVSRG